MSHNHYVNYQIKEPSLQDNLELKFKSHSLRFVTKFTVEANKTPSEYIETRPAKRTHHIYIIQPRKPNQPQSINPRKRRKYKFRL